MENCEENEKCIDYQGEDVGKGSEGKRHVYVWIGNVPGGWFFSEPGIFYDQSIESASIFG